MKEQIENPKLYRGLIESFCEQIKVDGSYADKAFDYLSTNFRLMGYVDDHTYGEVVEYYNKTVIPHKVAVFNEGMKIHESFSDQKERVKNQLIVHDFSKFTVWEMDYAFVNFSDFNSNSESMKARFERSWHHHKMNNPHHPEYWFNVGKDGLSSPMEMPREYIAEMVADWMGAGLTYGNTLQDWLPENLPRFRFHKNTALNLSNILAKYLQIETRQNDESGEFLKVVSQ